MVYYTHPVTLFRQRVSPIYDRLGLPSESHPRPPEPRRPPLKSKVVGILKCATHAQERSDDLYFSAVVFASPPLSRSILDLYYTHTYYYFSGATNLIQGGKKRSVIPIRNLLDKLRVPPDLNKNNRKQTLLVQKK